MVFDKRQAHPQQRIAAISGVVVFHLALIWAMAHGLGRQIVDLIPPIAEIELVRDEPAEPVLPPPQQPQFKPVDTITIPQIETGVVFPRNEHAVGVASAPVADTPSGSTAPAIVRTDPVVKGNACRTPDYPAASVRMKEAGTVLLQLLVGVDGRVTDSRVVRSTGYQRLDRAAVSALSSCRFTPATVNGQPEAGWAKLKYTFQFPD